MPMLNAVSAELYVNKAFVGLNGDGYLLAGRGYELAGTGVPPTTVTHTAPIPFVKVAAADVTGFELAE